MSFIKDILESRCIVLDESAKSALAKKASASGISVGTLEKVYKRGVAAWNSGHRPGTTPQQWGMARVNSYITKGKGTYGGADKDLHEDSDLDEDARLDKKEYHAGMSDSTAKARVAHWKKMDKLSDSDPKSYEPAPGDATAKTKESKHTKKYRELYGEEMKKIGEEEEVSSLKNIETTADYKTDKRGRKHKAHALVFNKGEEEENMKEELVGKQHKLDLNKNNKIDSEDLSTLRKLKAKIKKEHVELDEAEMSAEQMKERERIVKGMKKSYKDFVSKYGQERAKSVMYATATKMAMKEEVEELDEAFKPGDKVKYETSKYSKDNVGTVVSHKGDKVVVNHKDYLGANQELELHHSMVRMHDAPAKSDVVSNRHKVAVTVSEPDHPSVSQRKVKQQKFVKLTADDKNSAVEKAKKFYSGKGFKVHDAEYHSAINEEVSLDESDSIPSVYQKRDAAGTYHIEYSGKDKDGTTEKKLYKVKANDHHHAQFKVLKIGASDFPHHVQASSVTHKFIKEESINENNFAFHVQKAEDAKSRGDDVAFKHHMRIAGVKHSAMSDREKSETPKNVTLFQKLKEEVELDEAIDKEHPIVKEYDSLKKNNIATLRNLIKGQHRIVDTSEYKTKDHTISAYLRNKHGDKRVDQAFGFKEEAELDEGKKPDRYHIVNKDGTHASLASYLDKDNAIKDRDAKHPGAEVRQVGPSGKVKGVVGSVKEEVELDEAIKPYISGDHKDGWSILDSKGKEVKRFHHSDYDDHPIADKKTAAKNDAVRYLKKNFSKLSGE